MMLAWHSRSQRKTSPGRVRQAMAPALVRKPVGWTTAPALPVKRASRSSSSWCRVMLPQRKREPPGPLPQRRMARAAAASTRRSWVRPR